MDERPTPDLAAVLSAAPETAIAVLTDPQGFFTKMPREGGYEEPGMFAGVMLVAYGVILALLSLVGIGLHGFFAALILVPILGAIGLLIGSAILMFVSRALGGEATYESSFRIAAYASAVSPIAAIVSVVPYAPILVNAYALYIAIIAVIAVHRVPEDKAWRILGGIGAVLLVLALLATIAGRRAERKMEELGPELEKWGEQMEKNAEEVERASEEWRKKMEEATENMKRSLEQQQGRE
jgi:hypothetical protein